LWTTPGAKTNLTRLHRRAAGGQRVLDRAPQSHWRTTTLLAALRLDGATAPLLIEGPTDTVVFQAYVQQVLAPSLRAGDWVVLDNLSPHKASAVQAAIAAVGARVVFLPPYSPDLNPVEQLWSKVKAFLRQWKARTLEALIAAIRQALKTVTAADARGWFRHCGYVNTQD